MLRIVEGTAPSVWFLLLKVLYISIMVAITVGTPVTWEVVHFLLRPCLWVVQEWYVLYFSVETSASSLSYLVFFFSEEHMDTMFIWATAADTAMCMQTTIFLIR